MKLMESWVIQHMTSNLDGLDINPAKNVERAVLNERTLSAAGVGEHVHLSLVGRIGLRGLCGNGRSWMWYENVCLCAEWTGAEP